MHKVCERFKNKTAKEIEDVAHGEAPWKETSFLEVIPYQLAANDNDCLVEKEEIELLFKISNN